MTVVVRPLDTITVVLCAAANAVSTCSKRNVVISAMLLDVWYRNGY
jgi:hypothetical protein